MKIAHSSSGEPIVADAGAPAQAVCPHCGGRLILRSRRLMGSMKLTYYWRHGSNRNLRCDRRSRPSFLSRPNGGP